MPARHRRTPLTVLNSPESSDCWLPTVWYLHCWLIHPCLPAWTALEHPLMLPGPTGRPKSIFNQDASKYAAAAAAAKSLQSCLTLCDPIDSSPPGPPVPGILQARTLQWVAISFSNAWKWSHSVVSESSRPDGLQPTRLLHPWDFPGKSTGVGYHCLLQERP